MNTDLRREALEALKDIGNADPPYAHEELERIVSPITGRAYELGIHLDGDDLPDRPQVQYVVVVVGPRNDAAKDDTFIFGPYDAEEADEMAYQLEFALGKTDRDIRITTLARGLARWFSDPDPKDETLVEIEP